jgi:hypothetical protein
MVYLGMAEVGKVSHTLMHNETMQYICFLNGTTIGANIACLEYYEIAY